MLGYKTVMILTVLKKFCFQRVAHRTNKNSTPFGCGKDIYSNARALIVSIPRHRHRHRNH